MALDFTTLVSIAGALGVGSVIGQWAAGGKDRRTARANALKALSDVELARWVGPNSTDDSTFNHALREMETAALIARLPRGVVRTYVQLATAAHMMSYERWEENPDPEWGGGISTRMAELVRTASTLLNDAIWSNPVWRRARARLGLRALNTRIDKLEGKRERPFIDRARELAR